jgi:hypothetical protein
MVPKSACASSDSAPFRDDATAARHSTSPDYLSNSEDDGQILDSVLSDDKENTNHVNIETRDEEHPHPPKRCRVGCSPNLTSPCQEGTALPISEQPESTLTRQPSAFSGEIYQAITPCQAAGHSTPLYPEEIIPIDPAILNDRTAANDWQDSTLIFPGDGLSQESIPGDEHFSSILHPDPCTSHMINEMTGLSLTLRSHFQTTPLEGQIEFLSWLFQSALSPYMAQPLNIGQTEATRPPQATEHSATRYSPDEDAFIVELRNRKLTWKEIEEQFAQKFSYRGRSSLQVHYCTKLKRKEKGKRKR